MDPETTEEKRDREEGVILLIDQEEFYDLLMEQQEQM